MKFVDSKKFKLPSDTQALIDHRYLWDAQGNLLLTQSKPASANASSGSLTAPEPQAASGRALHLYDERDRLIVSVRKQPGDQSAVQPVSANASSTDAGSIRTHRYFYDVADWRVEKSTNNWTRWTVTSKPRRPSKRSVAPSPSKTRSISGRQ